MVFVQYGAELDLKSIFKYFFAKYSRLFKKIRACYLHSFEKDFIFFYILFEILERRL